MNSPAPHDPSHSGRETVHSCASTDRRSSEPMSTAVSIQSCGAFSGRVSSANSLILAAVAEPDIQSPVARCWGGLLPINCRSRCHGVPRMISAVICDCSQSSSDHSSNTWKASTGRMRLSRFRSRYRGDRPYSACEQ